MADEEFAELGDIQLSQFDRSNAHWASTNCGRGGTTFSCATSEHQQQTNRLYSRRPISTINSCGVGSGGGATYYSRAAEAEDVMGHYNSYKSANYTGTNNNKWSLYYSPPGTSSLNTIAGSSGRNSVHHQTQLRLHPRTSNNSMAVGKQQQPLSSAQHFYQQRNATGANNKRPISPEQVIKMLSSRQHNKTTVANNVTNNLKSPSGSSNPQAQSFSRKLPNQAPNLDELPVKTITMIRDNTPGTSQGFGICVKGGSREPNNVGVYISRVEEGGVAEKAGLRPGDSILEVNGIPFNNISHEEALKILKSKQQITMTVKTTPLSQRLNLNKNNSWILQHSYTWIDRMGRTVSPPPDYVKTNTSNKWTSSKISKEKIRKAELTIDSGQTLGLVIRGGIEYGLGIFITGVDKNSVADKAGLQIGDQILDVNGTSFLDITHDDAVSYLKQYNRMTITIRDVGKIPHSFTTYDTDSSTHPRTTLRKIPRSQTIQMIEEKASIVLEKNDFENFSYYLEEYCSKKITFDTFITVLMDLLDTPEKYTLMTELREVFTTEDKPKFDEIVYQKHSSETQKNYNSKTRLKNAEHTYGRTSPHIQNIPSQQTRSKINKFSTEDNYVTCTQETDGLRSPSEDSGLGLGPPEMGNGRNVSTRNFRNESGIYSDQKQLRHDSEFQSQVSIEEDLGYYHQDYSEDEPVPRTKRRSSVSECIQRSNDMNPTCEDANMLARKLGQGCDINDTNNKDQQTGNRQQQNKKGDSSSSEKNAHIVTDSQGNLRITVKKTKPLLGIAIEGGVNTRHPLPRIINIHEHGAAFEAGGLEVGQLILEVDRRKVEGMQHQEVARLIAEIYANRDCPTIEFLVVEAKKSNMEPKPTALIFLDN